MMEHIQFNFRGPSHGYRYYMFLLLMPENRGNFRRNRNGLTVLNFYKFQAEYGGDLSCVFMIVHTRRTSKMKLCVNS